MDAELVVSHDVLTLIQEYIDSIHCFTPDATRLHSIYLLLHGPYSVFRASWPQFLSAR